MKKVLVDNFSRVESYMDFKKSTFYKFAVIVRNKDGRTPLITKESASGETVIKQWYVDSEEYYLKRAKPEMIALAEATRGRLYMCVERKSSYKMIMLLFDKISDIIKEALSNATATPKRLNKIVNGITSDSKCTDKGCKMLMYDIDNIDECYFYRNTIKDYLVKRMSVKEEDIQIFPSKDGWHVLCPRCFAIENDWRVTASYIALEYARATYPDLTPEQKEDIINTINDIKVEPNQMCLVYYCENN